MYTMITMLNCFAGLLTAGMGIALANALAQPLPTRRQWRLTDLPAALFLGMIVAEGLCWSVGQ